VRGEEQKGKSAEMCGEGDKGKSAEMCVGRGTKGREWRCVGERKKGKSAEMCGRAEQR